MIQLSPAIWVCIASAALAGGFGVLNAAAVFMRNHSEVTDLQRRARVLRLEYSKRSKAGEPGDVCADEPARIEERRAA